MIRVLLVTLLTLSSASGLKADVPVDFDAAIGAYESGQHEAARTAFERMARAGLIEAQFNFGVMQLNGEGGSRDLIEGSAWILLAAFHEHEAAQSAEQALRDQLGEERMAEVEDKLEILKPTYSRQSLLERHRPQPCSENCTNGDKAAEGFDQWPELADDPDITILAGKPARMHREPPSYPHNAAARGIMGHVRLGGWINADGHIEHPHVISSDPGRTFDRAALDAISDWRYEWLEGPPDSLPTYRTNEISFTLDTDGGPTLQELGRAARAADDDPSAAHRAVWLIENLELVHQLEQPLSNESIITIIHRSAMAGATAAQIDLGRRFQAGKGIEQDAESAEFWLQQAAIEGDSEAQFELSRFRDRLDPEYRRDLQRAAARAGMLGAIIAEIRTQISDPDHSEPEFLSDLVDMLPSRLRDDSDDGLVTRARQLMDPN